MLLDSKFLNFDTPPKVSLPKKLNNPFYHKVPEIAKIASAALSKRMKLLSFESKKGKMFGVLVVKTKDNKLGYLAAFSGKPPNKEKLAFFVPPVYEGYYQNEWIQHQEKSIAALTQNIKDIEEDQRFKNHLEGHRMLYAVQKEHLLNLKIDVKLRKRKRKQLRKEALELLSEKSYEALMQKHSKQSYFDQWYVKDIKEKWKKRLQNNQATFKTQLDELRSFKKERKKLSQALQKYLFEQFVFINQNKEEKNLPTLFKEQKIIQSPSGVGECATPRLLQYAFKKGYEPIAITEFWLGPSPPSEIRQEGHFYSACNGRCGVILPHMLSATEVDQKSMYDVLNPISTFEILYEDEHLIAINKPHNVLSVPGKKHHKSVLVWLQEKYPKATGPLLLHRLDMSTSGILLAAKSKEIHKAVQILFAERQIEKYYIAELESSFSSFTDQGEINLPICPDYLDRPRQMVSPTRGKDSKTLWKRLQPDQSKCHVIFKPITGRTHQLRVHAAHQKGLNAPIVGDELYGKSKDRLYLHASQLSFVHPVTKELVTIISPPPFLNKSGTFPLSI